MTLTPKQQELVDSLALDLTDTVKAIESSPATTQNHYGRYGALLSQVSKGNKSVAFFLVLALIKAGSNPTGVQNAFKLFT